MSDSQLTEHERLTLDEQKANCYGTFVRRSVFSHWAWVAGVVLSLLFTVVGWNIRAVTELDKVGTAAADKRLSVVESRSTEVDRRLARIEDKLDNLVEAFTKDRMENRKKP